MERMDIYWERERSMFERANLINTGISKGKYNEKINTILRSYKLGFSVEDISKIVELGIDEVNEIISTNVL